MESDRKDKKVEASDMVGGPINLQDQLVDQIINNLKRVYDPEINLNVMIWV